MAYRQLFVPVNLHAEAIDRLKLLLDLEWRRIWDESPSAIDDPTTYASAISRLRDQFTYLSDRNHCSTASDLSPHK